MGKRRGGFSGREDQYGEFGSQDRPDRQGFGGAHKSGGGGGTGGSQTRHKGQDLSFQKHVPKFLQQYQHLLGKGQSQGNEDGGDEDAPVTVGGPGGGKAKAGFDGWSDEEDGGGRGTGRDEDVEADALRRAMEENPALAAEFEGKLQEKLNQAKAVEEKEKGNRAFSAKQYKEAIECFTHCIELDPQGEVYWSNRSAAHAALEDWEAAAKDAKQAVQLKPRWAKAHSRLAVAFYGLKLYSDAVESYKRALALEPDDQALQRGLEKAQMMELQHIKDRKHVFFNKKQKLEGGGAAAAAGGGRGGAQRKDEDHKEPSNVQQKDKALSARKGPVSLSFNDDE